MGSATSGDCTSGASERRETELQAAGGNCDLGRCACRALLNVRRPEGGSANVWGFPFFWTPNTGFPFFRTPNGGFSGPTFALPMSGPLSESNKSCSAGSIGRPTSSNYRLLPNLTRAELANCHYRYPPCCRRRECSDLEDGMSGWLAAQLRCLAVPRLSGPNVAWRKQRCCPHVQSLVM